MIDYVKTGDSSWAIDAKDSAVLVAPCSWCQHQARAHEFRLSGARCCIEGCACSEPSFAFGTHRRDG